MNHQLPLARQAAALGISRGSLYYHPDRVTTMMRRMSIEAVYRRPDTSKPTAGHKSYPYLLRSLRIDQPNQA